jgi:hypothetical protein
MSASDPPALFPGKSAILTVISPGKMTAKMREPGLSGGGFQGVPEEVSEDSV